MNIWKMCVWKPVAATSLSCLLIAAYDSVLVDPAGILSVNGYRDQPPSRLEQPVDARTDPSDPSVESLLEIWVQESCGLQTSAGKAPLTTARQLYARTRLSYECGKWRLAIRIWINSVCVTYIHSRPITDVLCVMCDNEGDQERVDEVSSDICSVSTSARPAVMSPWEDLPSNCLSVLRRQSGVNSASTDLAFLHFYTTSPSASRRLVNGKSSALLTGAHISSSLRTLNATWRGRRAVGRLLDCWCCGTIRPVERHRLVHQHGSDASTRGGKMRPTTRLIRRFSMTDEHLAEWCAPPEKSRESTKDMSNCRGQLSDRPDANTAPQLLVNRTSDQ